MLIPYFPNPFSLKDYNSILTDKNTELNLQNLGFSSKYQFVNKAGQGIYLLLKSFNLEQASKVGLPPLVCNSVTDAVLKAGFTPFYFDINNDFIFNYDEETLKQSGICVLILPQLYGALHPQTEEIISWCKRNQVFLISDTAQSFGLKFNGLPAIELGDGGIYSFGYGKASTCAGGAMVYNLHTRIKHLSNAFVNSIYNMLSKNKLAVRTYGINIVKKDYLMNKLNSYISNLTYSQVFGISRIQFNSIKKFLEKKNEIQSKRNKNYMILKENLNSRYFVVPNSFSESLRFKFPFSLKLDEKKTSNFITAMREKGIEIHNCSQTAHVHTYDKKLYNYNKLKNKLFELSTESSIPEENFYKASEIMNSYFTDT
jgi:dTDP-4-amino-4,6-dideoxygalactose transaminase